MPSLKLIEFLWMTSKVPIVMFFKILIQIFVSSVGNKLSVRVLRRQWLATIKWSLPLFLWK